LIVPRAGISALIESNAKYGWTLVRRLAFLGCALSGCQPVQAGNSSNQESAATTISPLPSFPDALRQITNPYGLRSRLEHAGLTFTFTYYGDALGNPFGGVQQGMGYSGRFGTIIDGDLEKLAGWSGASFHASIHEIHGYGLSAHNLDNLMLVSSVEAPDSIRLFNLWIEQKLNSDTTLRVGQYTAAQEFFVSKNANLFVNSTFGWPVLPAQDLPSGGPAYPEGALGVRLKYKPNDQIVLRAAVFDGDQAGPGAGNPVTRDPYGLAFRINDPAFAIAEAVYLYNQNHPEGSQDNLQQEGDPTGTLDAQSSAAQSLAQALPGSVKFGAWYHAGSFADQRYNARGGLLAASSAQPLEHAGNLAVYAVFDQMIWRANGGDGERGLSFFMRATTAPSDRNPIDLYLDAGLTFKGPVESRPDDALGLGFAFGRVSPQAAAHDRDLAAQEHAPMPIRNFEATIELTYQFQLAKNWTLQPDVQYVVHPGANIADPLSPNGLSPIPNAAVIGLRTVLKF
jgi:porin